MLPPLHESWLPSEHSLYRPRHSTKQRSALIAAMIFFCTPLLLLVVGVRAPEIENRRLASFPTPDQGWGLLTGLSPWATDHLPLRDVAVRAGDGISRGAFGEPPAFGQGRAGTIRPPQGPAVPPSPHSDGGGKLSLSSFPDVVEGQQDWLYLGADMMRACLPDRPAAEVVDALRRLRSAVEASGRRFVLVVAPNKSTMVPEFLPGRYVGRACAAAARDEFWLRTAPASQAVDLREGLRRAAARKGAPVYWPFDTHWTQEGAMVMVRAMAEAVLPGSTASWRVEPSEVQQSVGDLTRMLGREREFGVQTYTLAPDGSAVRSRDVRTDLMEPVRLTQQFGGTGVVDPSVGLIADSFTLSALSYLAGAFRDLTVVHSISVETDPGAMAAELAETDVVVLESVERNLIGGNHPLLDPGMLGAFIAELARHPR